MLVRVLYACSLERNLRKQTYNGIMCDIANGGATFSHFDPRTARSKMRELETNKGVRAAYWFLG